MATQYRCKNRLRLKEVTAKTSLQGIDYLEVGPDQKALKVYLIRDKYTENGEEKVRPAPDLKKENIIILGGVRIRGGTIRPGSDGELALIPGNLLVESVFIADYVLTAVVSHPGDFSTYTLRLVESPTHLKPPAGFDVQLCEVEFSFKVACPSDFDCAAARECPTERLEEPEINYLAKDYASFRHLMLDRLSIIMPDWKERNHADLQVALVELLAYVGDHLSYLQDAVATEAYLGAARKRVSVRRHARLLDYLMHDGCNARTWVRIEIKSGGEAEGKKLPKGTPLLTRGLSRQCAVAKEDLVKILQEEKPTLFETMHDVTLYSSHNEIRFYTWSDSSCCLPKGSTRAFLLDDPAARLLLCKGDVLVFEEKRDPEWGQEPDADPWKRQAVRLTSVFPEATIDRTKGSEIYRTPGALRTDEVTGKAYVEIEWAKGDALQFPLCISALVSRPDGKPEMKDISVGRGNVVLADHGYTCVHNLQLPAEEPIKGYYSLKLPGKDITFSIPYDHDVASKEAASSLWNQDPRKALPSNMSLQDANENWTVKRDLLGSDRFQADFVAEIEADAEANLRFGDGVVGKKPLAGTIFKATYRIGNGHAGNVGHEAITRIVTDFKDINRVSNPLPAVGGIDAETMEQVRQFAPHAFRTQERAVTEEDYEEVTERHSEVQKAAATFRWTGSWYTAFITIDRKGGGPVDTALETEIRQYLEKYRLAGYDLEVNGPEFVPLDILIMTCVKPGYVRSHVKERLLKAFSSFDLPEGQRGFFHPDNFTFGQPVYLSKIYQRAMEIAGVASVEVLRFQRWGKAPLGEKDTGVLKPGSLEIIQLDNDPNFPENGKIDFQMQGGL